MNELTRCTRRWICAGEGFATGLDGQYLIDSVGQVFTASGWRTTVHCNVGKAGKVQAKGSVRRR